MWRKTTLIAGMVSLIMSMFSVPAAALTTTEYENRIATKINQIRIIHGNQKVRPGKCVENVSERWARVIRDRQILIHQETLHIMNQCNAEGAGEVLGMGKLTPRQMIWLWMASPPHRRVILNRRYNRIGVGAVRDVDGYWWVAVDFLDQD